METTTKTFSIVKKIIFGLGFPEFTWVYLRPTVSDLFKANKRCGIYVLRFRDNHFYVGQAVDVIRRYVQHAKVHDDIQEISFKCFPQKRLNEIEQFLVRALETKKVKLRNINLTSLPKGDTDLELIVSKKNQEKWLEQNSVQKLNKHIVNNPDLQAKYSKKYSLLLVRDDFHRYVFPFLKEYFSKCLIQPEKTELSFWSLTCLPYQDFEDIVLCRLNLFWCEVLTLSYDRHVGKIYFSFHLTKSVLKKSHLKSLKLKSLFISDHFYVRGGPDQFQISVHDFKDAMLLLNDGRVLTAIKTFNLRQMQKGATVYGRYHCIDLAKLVLVKKTSK